MTALPRGVAEAEAGAFYAQLFAGGDPARAPFDLHALASVIALAAAEARLEGGPLAAHLGLQRPALVALLEAWFPRAETPWIGSDSAREPPHSITPEEERLASLLRSCASAPEPLAGQLSALLARRAQRPRHLWQDLGLQSRGELSRLMARHFAPLAARNRGDMKWKKFFSRALCDDGSFPICTAPSCSECDDVAACFGDEPGTALLALRRR
jgi:nitrogen fixation protein NifQ